MQGDPGHGTRPNAKPIGGAGASGEGHKPCSGGVRRRPEFNRRKRSLSGYPGATHAAAKVGYFLQDAQSTLSRYRISPVFAPIHQLPRWFERDPEAGPKSGTGGGCGRRRWKLPESFFGAQPREVRVRTGAIDSCVSNGRKDRIRALARPAPSLSTLLFLFSVPRLRCLSPLWPALRVSETCIMPPIIAPGRSSPPSGSGRGREGKG